jgi:hypothetical protein
MTIDPILIDYLKSGKAWVLVGTGPSIERGYPSWESLAHSAIDLVKAESPNANLSEINSAFKRQDYPFVFDQAISILGSQRVLQYLNGAMVPSRTDKKIYELIAQWPIPVYLTTNFDDEITRSLVAVGQSYISYTNSEDHFGYLVPDLNGAIFKLHGDLRSDTGLILSASQYKAIKDAPEWEYWRTKMTSVFQMSRIVIIGHSLRDAHFKHVLEAAKAGAGVVQPICWIAPDATDNDRKEFLEKYKIRVISYDNRDGEHQNLLRLLESISDFVPKRTSISIKQQIASLINIPVDTNAAAPGFFVFNRLLRENDFDEKRIQSILSALQSVIPQLKELGIFTLQQALSLAGWSDEVPLPKDFSDQICFRAIEQELLLSVGDRYELNPKAEEKANETRRNFEHQRERFIQSLILRGRQKFPALDAQNATRLAHDIESSLTIYFKLGGLSLATTLFSSRKNNSVIPSSIIKFIQEASSKYNDLLMRQAFCTISIDAFAHPESSEREYLGRIAQGFFAFHTLGIFGDVARERLHDAKKTVWLVDSSAQIPALALASPTCSVFRDCFSRFSSMGIRLFSTQKLFEETKEHLWFASTIIGENYSNPYNTIAAARGEPPYRKSNVFLEGFINWQAAGNPNDWNSYLYQIFESSKPDESAIKNALQKLGIEVVRLEDWPGYIDTDCEKAETYVGKIVTKVQTIQATRDYDQIADPKEKATPEAEAMLIVKNERDGCYHIISDLGEHSSSWFISDTSLLNIVEPGNRITWQTGSFLKFASTIFPPTNTQLTDEVFEILLLEFAQAGISLLDEKMVESVFGGIIDQATISIKEQHELYEETIGRKYGEDPNDVMARVPAIYRPLVAIQLSNEMAQVAVSRQKSAEEKREAETKRADSAERQLQYVEKYRKKLEAKKEKRIRKQRRDKSKSKK